MLAFLVCLTSVVCCAYFAAGALEAAPAMGSADIILDLVSTGVTLRENNLKQIEVRGWSVRAAMCGDKVQRGAAGGTT